MDEQKEDKKSLTELEWSLKRALILFRHWSMDRDLKTSTTSDDQIAARAFGLIIIVALAFAIRGEPVGGSSFAAIAAALAALVSFLLNTISNAFDYKFRDQFLITSYSSMIAVMIFFIFPFAFGANHLLKSAYEDLGPIGPSLLCTLIATVMTFVALVVKSRYYDKTSITKIGLAHAFGIILVCGLIVMVIASSRDETFRQGLDWLTGHYGQGTQQTPPRTQ